MGTSAHTGVVLIPSDPIFLFRVYMQIERLALSLSEPDKQELSGFSAGTGSRCCLAGS
jgi:hypothetical protein